MILLHTKEEIRSFSRQLLTSLEKKNYLAKLNLIPLEKKREETNIRAAHTTGKIRVK